MRINLAEALSGRPLLISDQGLRLVFAVTSRDEFFAADRMKAMQARDGEPLDNTHAVTVRDGVAIVPVTGPLFRFANLFTAISGATSYETIAKDLQCAIEDTNVSAILLDINSPGGDADGCGELADAIRSACEIKPVWAYVGGMGASAAYWIASSAQRITCAPSAFLGSIGVRTAIIDTSKAEASAGVREIEIISSNAPGKRDRPVDDEIVAKAQKHVDALEALFVGAVAANRGVSVEVVKEKFGQGDIVIGNDLLNGADGAVAKGMADALGSFESTLAGLVAATQQSTPALVAVASNPAPRAHRGDQPMAIPKNIKPAAKTTPPSAAADPNEPAPPAADAADGDPADPGESEEDKKKDAKSADPEDPPKADDGEEPMQEKAALAVIARKHGLAAGASKLEILTAAAAGSVPMARLDALVEEKFAAERAKNAKERAKIVAHENAVQLAADAERGGWVGDKADLVALAEGNYKATENTVKTYVEQGRKLFAQVTAGGAPIGMGRPASAIGGAGPHVSPTTGVIKMGRGLSGAIAAYRKEHPKATYEQAAVAAAKEHPELAEAYFNGQ